MKRKRKRWWLILSILFVVLAIGLRFGNPRIEKQPVEISASHGFPIEVATFNAHLLPAIANRFVGKRKNSDYRIQAIVKQLQRYDIVGLCEVFDERMAASLIDEFNNDSGRQFSFVRSPEPESLFQFASGGLILLTRFPIVADDSLVFSTGSRLWSTRFQSGDGLAAKGVVYARVKIGNQDSSEIDCFLTHLDSYSKSVRAQQIREMATFIQKNRHGNNPLLIMGDFNIDGPLSSNKSGSERANESLSEYQFLTDQFKFDETLLMDIATAGTENAVGTSDVLATDGGRRIDYIFWGFPSGSPVQWNVASRTLPLLDDQIPEGSLSDHAALWCEIRNK